MAILRLRPFNSVGTVDDWSLGKGTTKMVAVDPGDDFSSHDDDVSYLDGAAAAVQRFKINSEFPIQMSSVASVTLKARVDAVVTPGEFKLAAWDLSATGISSTLTPGSDYTDHEFEMTTQPAGGAWTEAKIRDSDTEFGIVNVNGWSRLTSLWPEIDYAPAVQPGQTSMPRLVASQILRLFRLPSGRVFIVLRASALTVPIMGDFFIEHYAGPYTDGAGWGEDVWHKRRLRVINQSHDPIAGTVSIEALDLRQYAVTHWDTMLTPFAVRTTETIISGPARLTRGTTRTFDRNSAAWIEEVGGVIVDVGTDQEKTGPNGTLFEGQSTNFVQNSAFQLGKGTDWTDVGGIISTLDTGDLLFDTDVSANSLKLTQSTPFTAGSGINQPATHTYSTAGGRDAAISIDYKADDAGALLLQDTTTGDFWNFSSESWGAADTGRLSLPASSIITRVQKRVDMASHGASTFVIGVRVGDVDASVMHIYHVQLEGDGATFDTRFATHASSRIVADSTSAEIREPDDLDISNDIERPAVNAEQGTAIVKVKSNWTTTQWDDSFVAIKRILGVFDVTGFSNPFFYLGYSTELGNSPGFSFAAHGTTANFTPSDDSGDIFTTAGDEHVIACRWTGPNAELDLPANSVSLFIDGELKDTSTGTATTHTSDGVLRVGRREGAALVHWDGWISRPEFLPYVLTDEEIKALP